jgi:hypothetical protein
MFFRLQCVAQIGIGLNLQGFSYGKVTQAARTVSSMQFLPMLAMRNESLEFFLTGLGIIFNHPKSCQKLHIAKRSLNRVHDIEMGNYAAIDSQKSSKRLEN